MQIQDELVDVLLQFEFVRLKTINVGIKNWYT